MSHADTYGEGGCATANECCKDALRNAHWEYTESGGALDYEKWLSESVEAKRILDHYRM